MRRKPGWYLRGACTCLRISGEHGDVSSPGVRGASAVGGAASLLSHLLSMFVSDCVSRLPGSPPDFVTSSSADEPRCGAVAMGALASLDITKLHYSNFFL